MSNNKRPNGRASGSQPVTRLPDNKSKQIKLVLLGESGVGKSSIALRFVRGEFNENGEATIGAAYLTKTINVQGVNIKFDIWDTAGQERYHSLAPMYYRGAPAAVVVYDITSPVSFMEAKRWAKEVNDFSGSSCSIILVGNKYDLSNENRKVSVEDGNEFATSNGLVFMEVSAKTGMHIEDVFYNLASKIAAQSIPEQRGATVRPSKKDEADKGGCAC